MTPTLCSIKVSVSPSASRLFPSFSINIYPFPSTSFMTDRSFFRSFVGSFTHFHRRYSSVFCLSIATHAHPHTYHHHHHCLYTQLTLPQLQLSSPKNIIIGHLFKNFLANLHKRKTVFLSHSLSFSSNFYSWSRLFVSIHSNLLSEMKHLRPHKTWR